MTPDNAGEGKVGKEVYCSFCGKNQHEVKVMLTAPMANICDECVVVAQEIVAGREATLVNTKDHTA